MNASSTSCDWLNLPEKSSPANTKTFLIHSFGRPVLIAARSGERRGTTGSAASACPASAGTVGCSEVMVSIWEALPGQAQTRTGQGRSSRDRVAPSGVNLPVIAALGGLQRVEIVAIAWAVAGALHLQEMLQGADAHDHPFDVDIARLALERGEGRNLGKALEDVDVPELRADQCAVTRSQEGPDRLRVEQAPVDFDLPVQLPQQVGQLGEVFRRRVRDEIDILVARR